MIIMVLVKGKKILSGHTGKKSGLINFASHSFMYLSTSVRVSVKHSVFEYSLKFRTSNILIISFCLIIVCSVKLQRNFMFLEQINVNLFFFFLQS